MKRALIIFAVFILLYAGLRQLALHGDFINALGRHQPLMTLGFVAWLLLRIGLVVLGPPLVAAGLWLRLTKS
jgi:hypothetical protein